jgi:hypothetical protein
MKWRSLFSLFSCRLIIVAYLLKARTLKPAEAAVVKERLCEHARC